MEILTLAVVLKLLAKTGGLSWFISLYHLSENQKNWNFMAGCYFQADCMLCWDTISVIGLADWFLGFLHFSSVSII